MPGLSAGHVQEGDPPDGVFQQLDTLKAMPLVTAAQ
jgi:hypothetical protein